MKIANTICADLRLPIFIPLLSRLEPSKESDQDQSQMSKRIKNKSVSYRSDDYRLAVFVCSVLLAGMTALSLIRDAMDVASLLYLDDGTLLSPEVIQSVKTRTIIRLSSETFLTLALFLGVYGSLVRNASLVKLNMGV